MLLLFCNAFLTFVNLDCQKERKSDQDSGDRHDWPMLWSGEMRASTPYHDQHIAIRVLILDIKLIASLALTVRGCCVHILRHLFGGRGLAN